MDEPMLSDAEVERENELYEKFRASGLTPEELTEVHGLLGVGAEWSTARRDAYIRGADNPWNGAMYLDNVVLAVEDLKAERGGEEI
jgi:hypothetical protein